MESFLYFIVGIFMSLFIAYIFRFKLINILIEFIEITESKQYAKWITNIAKKTKNKKKSIELYKKAISLGDNSFKPIFNLSVTFFSIGDFEDAIIYIDMAIKKNEFEKIEDDKLANAYLHKFNILFMMNDSNEKCEFYLNNSILLSPTIEKYINATSFYIHKDNLELAEKYLQKIKELDSQSYYYFFNKATILRKKEKYKESFDNALIAYNINPSSDDIKELCKDLYEDLKKIEETGGLPFSEIQKIKKVERFNS